MSKNTFGNFFKIIGETIEKIENSELVKDVKKTTSEKVESVEKYFEKEKETLDSNQNEKQIELRRLINAAKENSHEKNEDKVNVNASASSNHLSDNLKGIYDRIATELSKLSQNKMIALILGLSGSKDQSELSNLSATAIREVLLGLVIYLFKTGKSKFVFITLASMLGYKVYDYFKTQQDNKKESIKINEEDQDHSNDNENKHNVDIQSTSYNENIDEVHNTKKERDEILVDAIIEEVLKVNNTNGVKKLVDVNEYTPITKDLDKEKIRTIIQKRKNRRKDMQKNKHVSKENGQE